MNERIKLLAEQAGEYAAQNATGDWEVGPDYQDIFNKKFAELIVQRCAELSDLAEDNDLHGSTIIKRHFGVEE